MLDASSLLKNADEEGWRKPHPNIYVSAIKMSGFSCDETLFVGDDFINDYAGPRRIGLASIFLDKKKSAVNGCKKVNEFAELKGIL
ncbi:HAD family hydrolase [Clostridium sp. Mt-5]|uniref:HAD family hydrolase n=1 Tax=Clostridium moutaii TaxID=3240932 RepID=A0ABV4BV37_9CLOT